MNTPELNVQEAYEFIAESSLCNDYKNFAKTLIEKLTGKKEKPRPEVKFQCGGIYEHPSYNSPSLLYNILIPNSKGLTGDLKYSFTALRPLEDGYNQNWTSPMSKDEILKWMKEHNVKFIGNAEDLINE